MPILRHKTSAYKNSIAWNRVENMSWRGFIIKNTLMSAKYTTKKIGYYAKKIFNRAEVVGFGAISFDFGAIRFRLGAIRFASTGSA